MPVIWVAIALAAAIIEALTLSFGFIFVAAAALVGAAAAWFGLPVAGQLVLFSVTLILTIVFLRPRLMPKRTRKGVPSRPERLLGLRGTVTEAIDPVRGTGRVTASGEDWAARSDRPIPPGAEVKVDGHDGIHLIVSSVE